MEAHAVDATLDGGSNGGGTALPVLGSDFASDVGQAGDLGLAVTTKLGELLLVRAESILKRHGARSATAENHR